MIAKNWLGVHEMKKRKSQLSRTGSLQSTHNESIITPIEEIIINDGEPLKRHRRFRRRYRRGAHEISQSDVERNFKAALALSSGKPVLKCFSDAVKKWSDK